MNTIDWDTVREQGELGLLTVDETDALAALARSNVLKWEEDVDGLDVCPYCFTEGHTIEGCPIAVLEAVGKKGAR